MEHAMDPIDLALIVRALHQDVSRLDERLRLLESEIVRLRRRTIPTETIDLHLLGLPPRA